MRLDKEISLYLHIGISKTGTTSIQKFLFENKDKLLKVYKILYPQTGLFIDSYYEAAAHYFLAFSLYKPNEAINFEITKNFDEYIEELYYEIKETKASKVILSSEAFMHFKNKEVLDNFAKEINEIFNDVNIIVYLRRQDLWHESSYKQVVKDYGVRLKVDFYHSTLHSLTLNWLLNYDNFLEIWQNAFPKAKIIPRIYERRLFQNGSVINDFLSLLEVDMPEAKNQKIEANPSLSCLSTLVMKKVNEEFNLSPEEHGKIVQYLLKLDIEEGSPINTFFTLAERLSFLKHFRESNERLFRKWFSCENKFVLSEEEIKFYEEQDKIPKEEIERMVEERYEKVVKYLSKQI